MHITSNVRDNTKIPIGAVLVVLPMFPNSEARVTAITNSLPGGPQWLMTGAPLIVGPFTTAAELRIEAIEGDLAWDVVYIQDLSLAADFGALQTEVEGFDGRITTAQNEADALNTQINTPSTGIAAVVGGLNTTVNGAGGLGDQVTTLGGEYTALNNQLNTPTTGIAAVVGGHTSTLTAYDLWLNDLDTTYTTLNDAITALGGSGGGANNIPGVVGDNATDNSAFITSSVGDASTFVTAGKVQATFGKIGQFLALSPIDADPQVSLYMEGRGGITLVPSPNLPAIMPGTPGTGVRNGGGGESSLVRWIRRSPGIGKQAFEPVVGGWNIDGSSVKNFATFTVDPTTDTFTSTNHGRLNGDSLYVEDGPNGGDSLAAGLSATTLYYVINANTDHFQLALTPGGAAVNVTSAGAGQQYWTTNVHGFRVPNNRFASNPNDCDQDFDDKKEYTAGFFRDMDIVGMSGSGLVTEAGSGRLHCCSVRSMGNYLHGFDIASNDTIFSGHWAAGGNRGFGVKLGQGTGFYAFGGNLWGNPDTRGPNCGALWMNGHAYWVVAGTEFNDWVRLDGGKNFNNAGGLIGNMFHPHGVNYSSDGIGIDVSGTNDSRLQAHVGVTEYQGVNIFGNTHDRTDKPTQCSNGTFTVSGSTFTSAGHGLTNGKVVYTVINGGSGGILASGLVQGTPYYVINKTTDTFQLSLTSGGSAITPGSAGTAPQTWTTYPVWGNFDGALDGNYGTAPQYLYDITGVGGTPAMVQIVEGYCTEKDTKPWTGKFAPVTFTVGSPTIGWVGHPLVYGDRVRFHTSGTMPGGFSPDYVDYYVVVANTDDFQVATSFGGTPISATGSAGVGHACYQVGGSPYNIHNGGRGVGVYLDSSRGVVKLWSRNGSARKFMVGLSETDPWEGNPNYACEFGDSTLHSGVAVRNALYGSWELQNPIGYTAAAVSSNTYANADGLQTFNATVKSTTYLRRITLQNNVFATGTITLGTPVANQPLRIVVSGKAVTGLTWAGTAFAGASATPPGRIPAGGAVIDLFYVLGEGWYFVNARTDGGFIGRTDGVMTPAGVIGEQIQSKVASGSAVALTSGTVANLTSITLTAGDWDVSASTEFTTISGSSITPTQTKAHISTASNSAMATTDSTAYASRALNLTLSSGNDFDSLPVGKTRITVAAGATQTVWLNARCNFGGTTPAISVYGALTALRVR